MTSLVDKLPVTYTIIGILTVSYCVRLVLNKLQLMIGTLLPEEKMTDL